MGNLNRTTAALAIALLLTSAAHGREDVYEIRTTLLHQGRPFADAVMLVRAGEAATIERGGADAFELALMANRIDERTVRIEADLQSVHGTARPTLLVEAGEPASITVGAIGLEVAVAPRAAED